MRLSLNCRRRRQYFHFSGVAIRLGGDFAFITALDTCRAVRNVAAFRILFLSVRVMLLFRFFMVMLTRWELPLNFECK